MLFVGFTQVFLELFEGRKGRIQRIMSARGRFFHLFRQKTLFFFLMFADPKFIVSFV